MFVVAQRRRAAGAGSPLVPPGLFRSRGYCAGVVAQAAFTGSMAGLFLILMVYLQVGLRYSAIDAGLVLLPFSLGAFVGSGLAVPLAARAGRPMVVLGALLQAAGLAWCRIIVSARGDALGRWDPLPALAVIGQVFFGHVGDGLGVVGADPGVLRSALLPAALVSVAGYLLAAVAGLALPPSPRRGRTRRRDPIVKICAATVDVMFMPGRSTSDASRPGHAFDLMTPAEPVVTRARSAAFGPDDDGTGVTWDVDGGPEEQDPGAPVLTIRSDARRGGARRRVPIVAAGAVLLVVGLWWAVDRWLQRVSTFAPTSGIAGCRAPGATGLVPPCAATSPASSVSAGGVALLALVVLLMAAVLAGWFVAPLVRRPR